jgi:hypothetical protein
LIFELARIGMIPKFSCCGYSYEKEEEPKTHHGSQAYVFFYAPEQHADQFKMLMDIAGREHWNPRYFNNFTWHISVSNPVPDDLYDKSDGINEAIHQYEGYGIRIEKMAFILQEYFKTRNDPVTIIDGNSMYDKVQNWIVRPKQNFTIGVNEYYKKYGKIDVQGWSTNDEQKLGISLLNPEKVDRLRNKSFSQNTSTVSEFQAQIAKK